MTFRRHHEILNSGPIGTQKFKKRFFNYLNRHDFAAIAKKTGEMTVKLVTAHILLTRINTHFGEFLVIYRSMSDAVDSCVAFFHTFVIFYHYWTAAPLSGYIRLESDKFFKRFLSRKRDI